MQSFRLARRLRQRAPDRAWAGAFARDHGLALLIYATLSIALSWPTVLHFTTALTSTGGDARHELWMLWHTQQVLLGRQPLFDAPLLYYPRGATLLVHSTGPVTGLLALPFWPWGPAAAFNGTLLFSLALSGYAMYLLARGLGFARGVALFAGTVVLAAPMSLAGLPEHLTKVFTAGMPLVLLAVHHTLDPRRSRWWAAAFGAAMLFVLLHNGYQFVYIGLAAAFFFGAGLLGAERDERRAVFMRCLLAGASALVLAGPLLFAILRASRDPALTVAANSDSLAAPDLAQFFLPDQLSLLFGAWMQQVVQPFAEKLTIDHETAVALAWVGLALCVPAALRGGRTARRWLLFTLLCVLFALGPQLQVMGHNSFTTYDLPVTLPYAFLTSLPGLEFMRTPGRFMQIGAIGLGIAACFGLAWLTTRLPRWRRPLIGLAIVLLLLQAWPRPFPSEPLRPVPQFYQQIAADPEQYGVFDLPVKPAAGLSYGLSYQHTSSIYQVYQITHGKGIAGGYLSRVYTRHPIFADLLDDRPPTLLVNGQPAQYTGFQSELARNGYRYVVLHKDLTEGPDAPFAPGFDVARKLLDVAFAGQPPVADDDLVTVYRVAPPADAVQANLGSNWRDPEPEFRWATSPATLEVVTAQERPAVLEISLALLHDPQSPDGLGANGVLYVQVGNQLPIAVSVAIDHPAVVPIVLAAGAQTISLRLQAGNFQPSQYGTPDQSILSFAVRSINLKTQ